MHTQCWQMRLVVSLLVVLSGLFGLPRHSPAHVVEFTCAAGDVACLIDAINQANANGEANTITLEAGTYTLTTVDNTTDGPSGLPVITSTLTITGQGAETTLIERDANAPLFRLLAVAATGTLRLHRLTLRGGQVPNLLPGGGGIANSGTLALLDCILTENRALQVGGGLTNSGTVTIAHTAFDGNSGGFFGGGLFNDTGGTVTITKTTFARNIAETGGGLSNRGAGTTLSLIDTTIKENMGVGAGAGIATTGTAILINTTLARNRQTAFQGGGLSNASGTVILINSTIAENTSNMPGGGARNHEWRSLGPPRDRDPHEYHSGAQQLGCWRT